MTAHERIMRVLDARGITQREVERRVSEYERRNGRRSEVDLLKHGYAISTVAALVELVAEAKVEA